MRGTPEIRAAVGEDVTQRLKVSRNRAAPEQATFRYNGVLYDIWPTHTGQGRKRRLMLGARMEDWLVRASASERRRYRYYGDGATPLTRESLLFTLHFQPRYLVRQAQVVRRSTLKNWERRQRFYDIPRCGVGSVA